MREDEPSFAEDTLDVNRGSLLNVSECYTQYVIGTIKTHLVSINSLAPSVTVRGKHDDGHTTTSGHHHPLGHPPGVLAGNDRVR